MGIVVAMPTVRKEMCTISKYQDFDSEIFEVTKIMIGFSLTDGQKTELLKIAGEIETACQDGSLSGDERQRLLDTMADCGLELPQPPAEPVVDEAKLQENVDALMEAIVKARPSALKGQYLRSITLATTMGPGVKVNTAKY